MAVATSTSEGKPSVRIVLLKNVSDKGFRFFTNYNSRKGREIDENPEISLLFHWPELERQVRIEGIALKTSNEISDEYFNNRPVESRISAIISPQSHPVSGRDYLEKLWVEKKEELSQKEIPRPEYWGGFDVIPNRIEFWQTAEKRLHDRILYFKEGEQWKITRLAP